MKKHIEKWLKEGLIDNRQAGIMLADIEKGSSENSSKKIIFTFSMIGAVLVGIGFILFMAANWQSISSIVKILMFAVLTFSSALGGYYLKYENKMYPKTGASLLFLSTLIFGALILLTAQIYNINAFEGLHILTFLWLVSVLPYIYIFNSKPVAVLTALLFILCVDSFIAANTRLFRATELLPFIHCLLGINLFCIGKLNSFNRNLTGIGEIFEKTGLFIIMICLFIITFPSFSDSSDALFSSTYAFFQNKQPFVIEIIFIVPIILFLFTFFANPSRTNDTAQSFLITFALSFCIFSASMPYIPRVYTNIFFAVCALVLIYSGYRKKSMFYVNLGILWLIIFIVVKYFDLLWELMPRSLFFLSGGIILILAALFFEHKRREIKTGFSSND